MICAEPGNLSVGDFINVGFVLSFKIYCRQQGRPVLFYVKILEYILVK